MTRFVLLLAIAAFLLPARAQAQLAYAWGDNSYGQLGNNSTTNSSVPVAVTATGALNGLSVTAVAAGGNHSLALANNSQVYAWGYNFYGQLGNNSMTNSSVPVAVTATGALNGLSVTAIAAGGVHSLALANGHVYAWGYGGDGELGNNSTTNSNVPVAVTATGVLNGLSVTAVAAGGNHSLALANNGQVYAWGYNFYGQLGNNSTTNSSVPVAVTATGALNGLSVTAITGGYVHSLALANGQVYAWGYNAYGQLGNNSTTNSSVPVAVTATGALNGLSVTAIAAGGYHSLALANGHVYAWGDNANGELGNNSTTNSSVPVAISSSVLNSLTVTQIAAGLVSSYALTSDGRLFAWGDNYYGELGIGSSSTSFTTPQEVPAPSGYAWASLSAISDGYDVVATVVPVPEPTGLLLAATALALAALRCRGTCIEIA